jgi:hypothetical protein
MLALCLTGVLVRFPLQDLATYHLTADTQGLGKGEEESLRVRTTVSYYEQANGEMQERGVLSFYVRSSGFDSPLSPLRGLVDSCCTTRLTSHAQKDRGEESKKDADKRGEAVTDVSPCLSLWSEQDADKGRETDTGGAREHYDQYGDKPRDKSHFDHTLLVVTWC